MSVRNARGDDSSRQSAQFGHKAKLFYAKERYIYICIYDNICLFVDTCINVLDLLFKNSIKSRII